MPSIDPTQGTQRPRNTPRAASNPAFDALLNRGKEVIGQQTQGALKSFDDSLSRRGFGEARAGGAERQARAGIIQQGLQGLTGVTRDATIQGAQRQERTQAREFEAGERRNLAAQQQRLALLELLSRFGLF